MQIILIQPDLRREEFTLQEGDSIKIGKNTGSVDFVIPVREVSGIHASIDYLNGQLSITDLKSTNGTIVNGEILTPNQPHSIKPGDQIILAQVQIAIEMGEERQSNRDIQPKEINTIRQSMSDGKDKIIGRAGDCDIVINHPSVSRRHAKLSIRDGKYFITDLGSVNGTYKNGKRIQGETEITGNDEIKVGLQALSLDQTRPNLGDSNAVAISAKGIEVTLFGDMMGRTTDKVILHKMDLKVAAGKFVALMGPSGSGKSTLLKALNNDQPATQGTVKIFGMDLNSPKDFNQLKMSIGYVPQDDIVHKELTLHEALFYAAKLRMSDDKSSKEIEDRIDEVLKDLNLNDPGLRKTPVYELSGGERKRVSIAVELLNNPSILFLDEPTSPLDPETIDEFLNSIRSLCRKDGITVIMVTHKFEDLKYTDQVIFIGAGGYHAFFGESDTLLSYFKKTKITEVYGLLKKKENAKEFYRRWYNYPPDIAPGTQFKKMTAKKAGNPFRQLFWLCCRSLNVKINDWKGVAILLGITCVISGLIIWAFPKLNILVLFMTSITSIFIGLFSSIKEIVNEVPIFKRERLVNLRLWPYYLSKLMVLTLVISIQIFILTCCLALRYGHPIAGVKLHSFGEVFFFLLFLSVSASFLGLFISAVSKNIEWVMNFLLGVLIVQIVFGGLLPKLESKPMEAGSYLNYSRWGMQGLAFIQKDYKWNDTVPGLVAGAKTWVGHIHKDTFAIAMPRAVKDSLIDEGRVRKYKNSENSLYKEILVDAFAGQDPMNGVIIRTRPKGFLDSLMVAEKNCKCDDKTEIYNDKGYKYESGGTLALGFFDRDRFLSKFDKRLRIGDQPFLKSMVGTLSCMMFLNVMFALLTVLALKRKSKGR